MSLRTEDLDGVKLVKDEYFLEDAEMQNELEGAYMQGSQGWGVTKPVAIILTLARSLHTAHKIANVSDERFRLLKGAQMALGREKKAKEALNIKLLQSDALSKDFIGKIVVLKASVDSLTATLQEQVLKNKSQQQLLDNAVAGRQELADQLDAAQAQRVDN